MIDLAKWFFGGAVGSGLAWLCWFLAKQWYEREKQHFKESVVDKLDEHSKDIKEVKRDLGVVRNSVSTLGMEVSESFTKLTTFVHDEFRHKPVRKPIHPDILDRISVLEKIAEKEHNDNETMKKILALLHEKNKALESEIVNLNKDMVLIKAKGDK